MSVFSISQLNKASIGCRTLDTDVEKRSFAALATAPFRFAGAGNYGHRIQQAGVKVAINRVVVV